MRETHHRAEIRHEAYPFFRGEQGPGHVCGTVIAEIQLKRLREIGHDTAFLEHAGDVGAADRFASGLIQHFLIAYIDANRPEPIKYLQIALFPVPTQAGQLGIQWGGMPGQPQPEQVDFPILPLYAELAPPDDLHAVLAPGRFRFIKAGNRIMVGRGNRRELQGSRPAYQIPGGVRSVGRRSVRMQINKTGLHVSSSSPPCNTAPRRRFMALNPELLALLACPVCRGELEPVDNESGLECPACGLVFPVRDNIPIMLQEEAIRKDDWERGQRKKQSR